MAGPERVTGEEIRVTFKFTSNKLEGFVSESHGCCCRRNPGSNPALGKQWSRDYPIDVSGCSFLLLSAQF